MAHSKPQTLVCPLDAWLQAETGRSQAQLAKLSGVPSPCLSNFRSRKRGLRWETMQKLERATRGGVKAAELLLWMNGVSAGAR
jgi:DNA-binding transcriptional regulator YdaS (Cro superfamily)